MAEKGGHERGCVVARERNEVRSGGGRREDQCLVMIENFESSPSYNNQSATQLVTCDANDDFVDSSDSSDL